MKQICDALRAGRSYRDIGAEFGISEQRVGQIREYAGIERRHRPRETPDEMVTDKI
jgi:hypothetical protein